MWRHSHLIFLPTGDHLYEETKQDKSEGLLCSRHPTRVSSSFRSQTLALTPDIEEGEKIDKVIAVDRHLLGVSSL